MVLSAECDGCDIAHAQTVTDDDGCDVVRGMCFLGSNDQILLVVLRETSNGTDAGRVLDGIGQIVVRETL